VKGDRHRAVIRWPGVLVYLGKGKSGRPRSGHRFTDNGTISDPARQRWCGMAR
jgi:hypothetical protein